MAVSPPTEASEGMTTSKWSHVGRSGDHAVMAEVLLRGWNVAIPEVDAGNDISVDENADHLIRVQPRIAGEGYHAFGPNFASGVRIAGGQSGAAQLSRNALSRCNAREGEPSS